MSLLVLFDIDGTILHLKSGQSKKIFSQMLDNLFGIDTDFNDLPDFAGKTDLQILYEIADKYNLGRKRIDNDIN